MESSIWLFILVGFVAQLIDGALGMAYKVSSTTFLLGLGVPPAVASASVHTASTFTTLVSGLAHWRLGNVDMQIFKKLVIPGVIGGIAGASILAFLPSAVIKPFVSAYLLIMGLVILRKVLTKKLVECEVRTHLIPLALVGGFFDAIGGGGWGPIVTSTIVARGHNPRLAVGSVNLAEFFVTLVQTATFFLTLQMINWQAILGLIVGGVIAAPFAALAARRIPARALMSVVGVLIIGLSVRTIYLAW